MTGVSEEHGIVGDLVAVIQSMERAPCDLVESLLDMAPSAEALLANEGEAVFLQALTAVFPKATASKQETLAEYFTSNLKAIVENETFGDGAQVEKARVVESLTSAMLSILNNRTLHRGEELQDTILSTLKTALSTMQDTLPTLATSQPLEEAVSILIHIGYVLLGLMQALARASFSTSQSADLLQVLVASEFVQNITRSLVVFAEHRDKFPTDLGPEVFTSFAESISVLSTKEKIPATLKAETFSLSSEWHQLLGSQLFQSDDEKRTLGRKDADNLIRQHAAVARTIALTVSSEDLAVPYLQHGVTLLLEGDGVLPLLPLYQAHISALATYRLRFPNLAPRCIDTVKRVVMRPSAVVRCQIEAVSPDVALPMLDNTIATCQSMIAADTKTLGEGGNGTLRALLSSITLLSTDEGEAEVYLHMNSIALLKALATSPHAKHPDVKLAVTVLYQRLMSPPSRIDPLLIEALAHIARQPNPSASVTSSQGIFNIILDMMLQILKAIDSLQDGGDKRDESEGGSKSTSSLAKYAFIGDSVYKALVHMAPAVSPYASTKELEKLLSFFNRIATGLVGKGLPAAAANASRLTVLLPSIGALTKHSFLHLSYLERRKAATQELCDAFRAFWVHVSVCGITSDKTESVQKSLEKISQFSPVLVDSRAKNYVQQQLETQVEHIQKHVDSRFASQICSQLNAALKGAVDVRKLDVPLSLYALATYNLEVRRLCQRGSNFFQTFSYAEDPGMLDDTRLPVNKAMVESLFATFLDFLATLRSGREKLKVLEDTLIFFLVKFTHRSRYVSKIADQFVCALTQRFPHVLWSQRVVFALLDMAELIHAAIVQETPIGQNLVLHMEFAPYDHIMPSLEEERLSIYNDFSEYGLNFLSQALTHCPHDVIASIQAYMAKHQSRIAEKPHMGLHLAMKTLHSHGAKNAAGVSQAAVFNALSHSILEKFTPEIPIRNHYAGQLEGILLAASVHSGGALGSVDDLPSFDRAMVERPLRSAEDGDARGSSLERPDKIPGLEAWARQVSLRLHLAAKQLKEASITTDLDATFAQFEEAMYQATAIAVHRGPEWDPLSHRTPGLTASITDIVVWQPVAIHSSQALATAVKCWRWIVSERPELETRLIGVMHQAWLWHIEHQKGMFSPETAHSQSREGVFESAKKERHSGKYVPPALSAWIAFLKERFSAIGDRSVSQCQLISSMVAAALNASSRISNLPIYWKPRYQLYSLALAILHGKASLNRNVQIRLRSTLYTSILQSFASPTQWTHTSTVSATLPAMIAAFEELQRDRSHCKELDSILAATFGARIKTAKANTRFTRRCELSLLLLRHEIERLLVWHHTSEGQNEPVAGESRMKQYTKPSATPSDRTWREYLRLAWMIEPALVVQIAYRYLGVEFVQKEAAKLVQGNPVAVNHVPDAIHFLVTKTSVAAEAPALHHVVSWCGISPVSALRFLREYPGHPIISQYCLKALSHFSPEVILFYIPQLVQVLRYDNRGFVRRYMLEAASTSQLLAHQMIWNMSTNIFTDEEGEEEDEVLAPLLRSLIEDIKEHFDEGGQNFYNREFDFFDQITGVSGRIKDFELGPERKAACLKELGKIKLQNGCYLPSSPLGVVVEIDYTSGLPMQSAAKAPYLAKFRVAEVGLEEIESIGSSTDGDGNLDDHESTWQACIFKVGDDVRQDMLALQIIQLVKNVLETVELDIALFPYRVVATGPGRGVIECVRNANSRDQLGRRTNISLYDYFLKVYGDEDTPAFQQVRRNFIKSMAAYSTIGFLLQIKDRHNGNIMVDNEGHIIHIDFGFMFESSPGGNIGFEPDFKLTKEMVMVMGGDQSKAPFRWFVDLCVRCYLAIRPYHEQIISLVALMLDTGLPCFRTKHILESLRTRFQPTKTDAEAAVQMTRVINSSYLNLRTELYDKLQKFQNQIAS